MEDSIVTVGCKIQTDIKPISRLLAMKKRLHQQRNGRPKASVECDSKLGGGKTKDKENESKLVKMKSSQSESKIKAKEISKIKSSGSLQENGTGNPVSKIPKSRTFDSGLDGTATRKSSKISRIFKSRSVELKLGAESKGDDKKMTSRSKTSGVPVEGLGTCEQSTGGATVVKPSSVRGTFSKFLNANERTQPLAGKHPNGIVHAPRNVTNAKFGSTTESSILPAVQFVMPAEPRPIHRQDNTNQMTKGVVNGRPCGEINRPSKTYSRVLIQNGGREQQRPLSDSYAVNNVRRGTLTNSMSGRGATSNPHVNASRPLTHSDESVGSDEGGFCPQHVNKVITSHLGTVESEKQQPRISQPIGGRAEDRLSERIKSNDVAIASSQSHQGGLRAFRPTDLKLSSTVAMTTDNARMSAPRRCTVSVGGMDLELGTGNLNKTPEQWEGRKTGTPRHAGTSKTLPPLFRNSPTDQLRRKIPHGSVRPDTTYDLDDVMSTMSETDANDTGQFSRGNRLRSSLPIVRSPNKSLDKALGLIYLNLRNETKRALLPNEVTSMDTVRALFVRSFPECLSMRWFEAHPLCRIYVKASSSDVFYELEDLRDVRDRGILKIHEPMPALSNDSPCSSPNIDIRLKGLQQGYESDSSACSAPPGVGMNSPRYRGQNKMAARPETDRTKTLPAQNTYKQSYVIGQLSTQTSGPNPNNRSPSHQPAYPAGVRNNQGSPQRAATLPANQGPPDGRLPQSRSYHDYPAAKTLPRNVSPPPIIPEQNRCRMDKMEAQLANLTAWVHTAVSSKGSSVDGSRPGSSVGSQPGSTRSISSISESSYSTKSKEHSATPTPLHSPPGEVGCQGVTDFPTADRRPGMNAKVRHSLSELQRKAVQLSSEVKQLKQIQLANMSSMKDTIQDAFLKIKVAVSNVPGANDLPTRQQRHIVDKQIKDYSELTRRVENDLSDLEWSVQGVRNDVLSKKCRVNASDVESMALTLSNVSKTLADLKAKFPALQDMMKSVMSSEMEKVVNEEKFIRDEPERVESALKKCKKLTGTVFTLKRLALAQEMQPLKVPVLSTKTVNEDDDRQAILDSIQAMIPNHKARLEFLQNAAESRDRLKKMTNSTETLRFEKSLELAQRQLRETKYAAENEQRAVDALSDLYKRGLTKDVNHGGMPSNAVRPNNCEVARDLPSPAKPPRGLPLFGHASPESTAPCPGGTTENGRQQYSPCFLTSSVMSSPSKTSVQSTNLSPILNSPNKPPLPPPVGTPTSNRAHVTFSASVTEIRSTSREVVRKVAPPPPPRKSSKVVAYISPRHSPVVPPRHPLYENVDEEASMKVNDYRGKVVAQPRSDASPTRHIILMSPPKPRKPLTKFQQDLAAGIFSDINRPDLQEQKLNAADVVRNSDTSSVDTNFSDSESSTSADSQLGVTALRQRMQMRDANGTIPEECLSPNGTQRFPPPPPERKNTHSAQQRGVVENGSGTHAVDEKQLMGVINKTISKYGETEIY